MRHCSFALLLMILGCSTWVPHRLPPPSPVWADTMHRHRLLLTTGEEHLFDRVHYEGDTLRGITAREGVTIAVPMSAIARLETRRFDAAKTAVLVSGIALLVAAANVIVARDFDESVFSITAR